MASRGRGWEVALFLDRSEMNGAAGDHKGPPNPTSSTLAPTGVDRLFLG